jgi:hypothetical protein
LRNHAPHTNPHNMTLPLSGPANVVHDLDDVFGHLGRRVTEKRLIRFADATVVKREDRILAALSVGEVLGLSLPGVLHATETHYELHRASQRRRDQNDAQVEMSSKKGVEDAVVTRLRLGDCRSETANATETKQVLLVAHWPGLNGGR